MVDRNTVVGMDFLIVGVVVSGLGYSLAQSVPIAAVGFDMTIVGALIILIVPETIPRDAYTALLEDSISNIEMIMEESMLRSKAYFVPTLDGRVRAMIPLSAAVASTSELSSATLIQSISRTPERFISKSGGVDALFLYPPGNEIVRLSNIHDDDDLEKAVHHALIEVSDLASSVVVLEESDMRKIKVQILKPRLHSDSPFFNSSLGSPLSCVVCCVIAVVKYHAVRIVDEKVDPAMIRLAVEVMA